MQSKTKSRNTWTNHDSAGLFDFAFGIKNHLAGQNLQRIRMNIPARILRTQCYCNDVTWLG